MKPRWRRRRRRRSANIQILSWLAIGISNGRVVSLSLSISLSVSLLCDNLRPVFAAATNRQLGGDFDDFIGSHLLCKVAMEKEEDFESARKIRKNRLTLRFGIKLRVELA
jgi:hypothetical protein